MAAETATVAEKVTIHVRVVTIVYALQQTVTCSGQDIATDRAAGADRRGRLKVPLAGIGLTEGLVGEYAGGTHLDQVAGKFVLQHPIRLAAEEHAGTRTERLQVVAAGIVVVIANTSETRDATIHLVTDERPEVLIAEGAFLTAVAARRVTRHHGHILQVAFAALFTNRTIVGMVFHQPFDDRSAKFLRLACFDGNARTIDCRCHTRHDQSSTFVVFILILNHRALPTGAHGTHRRMPAEIRQVQLVRQTGLQQVVAFLHVEHLPVYVNSRHV